jgi:hypothetical protein
MSGSGHHIDGRYSAGLSPLNARRSSIDTVEKSDIRLDGRGSVSSGTAADVAVRINKAGHDHFTGQIDLLDVCG